jgi:hypothetical protein
MDATVGFGTPLAWTAADRMTGLDIGWYGLQLRRNARSRSPLCCHESMDRGAGHPDAVRPGRVPTAPSMNPGAAGKTAVGIGRSSSFVSILVFNRMPAPVSRPGV